LGREPTKAELSEVMKIMDEDNSGQIDFDEFCKGMKYF
jgi:Ca2+-binding EF-hand superfamily protein